MEFGAEKDLLQGHARRRVAYALKPPAPQNICQAFKTILYLDEKNLFVFGYAGFSLLHAGRSLFAVSGSCSPGAALGFSLQRLLLLWHWALGHGGFSSCSHRLSWAPLPCMWDLLRPGGVPACPALAAEFPTTRAPGKFSPKYFEEPGEAGHVAGYFCCRITL